MRRCHCVNRINLATAVIFATASEWPHIDPHWVDPWEWREYRQKMICVNINGDVKRHMNRWMGRLVTSLRVVGVLMSGIILFYITIIMPHIIPRILSMHGPIARMEHLVCYMDTLSSWGYIVGQLKRIWKIKWFINCLFWWQSFDPLS